MRGLTDLSENRLAGLAFVTEMADDVFHHDDRAFDDHAEVESTEAEEIRGNVAEVEADGGKEQSKGNGDRDDQGSAEIAEEQEENEGDEKDADGEVVKHGFRGEVQ